MPTEKKKKLVPFQLEPFQSSLIDTVKVRLELEHEGLAALNGNANIRRNGNKYTVESRFRGVRANIWSPASNQHLLIEASVPKFLTGQNLLGIHDMRLAVKDLVTKVLKRAGIEMTQRVRRALRAGDIELLRADVAVHCKCQSEEEAVALMQAVRRLGIGLDNSTAMFNNETVYLGYRSRRRSLKLYRKDLELLVHAMPSGVTDCDRLLQAAENTVRIELTLRHMELQRLGYARVSDWEAGDSAGANGESDTVQVLLSPWIEKLRCIDARLPSVRGLPDLPPALRLRLRAWLLGYDAAFLAAPSTYRAYRQQVRRATGIDIAVPLTTDAQRGALKTVRSALQKGVRFHGHSDAWLRLSSGEGA